MALREVKKSHPTRRLPRVIKLSPFAALLGACGVLLAPVSGSAHAQSATRMVRVGSAPTVPDGSTPVATAASVSSMQLAVTLKPRNAKALAAYVKAVSNPASLLYHEYLSVAEFRRMFAPRAAKVRQIEAALRARGLRSLSLTANGMAIYVQTNTAVAQSAFAVQLAHVRTSSGADVTYNVQAPAFAANIAGQVIGVIGLDGFDRETASPELRRSGAATKSAAVRGAKKASVDTGGAEPSTSCEAAISQTGSNYTTGSYTADQIASAYSFSGLYQSGDLGQGQTIAIFELEPDLPSDIATYQACYGTNTSVTYVNIDGGAKTTTDGEAGEGEATLDIEQVIGLAPKAKILVYQGPNSNSSNVGSGPYKTLAAIINQNKASVVATSWGECEEGVGLAALSSEYLLAEEAAVQGQTIVAAAGDDGSEDCYGDSSGVLTGLAVDDPASDPLVTGVGGTSISAIGPAPTETAWNSGAAATGGGAGGGGVSNVWLMPAYQRLAASSLNLITSYSSKSSCYGGKSYCREVPDVSADADENHGYVMYYSGAYTDAAAKVGGYNGWQSVGGTSAAAPLWAALVAEANASSACASRRMGLMNGALYRLASKSQSTYFNDVTSGNNDMLDAHSGRYPAHSGYDMATGLGSPIASSLAPALCGVELVMNKPTNHYTFKNAKVRLQVHAKQASSAKVTVTYTASHLPKGLTLNRKTGLITGRPTKLGVSNVTVAASTADEVLRTVSFKWTIERRPVVSSVKLSNLAGGYPRLSFAAAAGTDEPGITALTVSLPATLDLTGSTTAVRVWAGSTLLSTRITVSGRQILISLPARERQVSVAFGTGVLRSSSALTSALKRSGTSTVRIAVVPTDAAGGVVKIAHILQVKK